LKVKNISSRIVGQDYYFSFRGVEIIKIELSKVPENCLVYLDLPAGQVVMDGQFLLDLSKQTNIDLQSLCCALRKYPLVSTLNGETEVFHYN